MKSRHLSVIFLISLFFFGISVTAQGLSELQIDSLVQKTMSTFDVPGIAVAVLKDGEVVHRKGYGTRSLEDGGKVDENSLFGVASNTKAMTSAALATWLGTERSFDPSQHLKGTPQTESPSPEGR